MTPALLEGSRDPTTAVRVLNRMRAAGFALSVEDGRLMCEPLSRLSEEQRATLRAHKSALINLLTDTGLSTPPPALAPEVRCSDCHHGQPATPGDPWSWHLCTAGADRAHGWGMAARRCGRWESRESHPPRRRAETIAP